MKRLEFTIEINTSIEKIWETLWNDTTYRDWVSVFCEGTYVKTNWNEGDSVHFLTPDGKGMNSIIEKKLEHQYIAFKHISELENFEPQPVDETTSEWTGAMEIYELIPSTSSVTLKVLMDTLEKYIEYFETTFPKALERVKTLSENNQ
ncbi:MAG: SRPBCC domain-containing protein [Flavobacteriales bacterium]|nr:SRPBCC domain-containing protein [Flavobacteriales bacterium]